jgi:hypothetical protein
LGACDLLRNSRRILQHTRLRGVGRQSSSEPQLNRHKRSTPLSLIVRRNLHWERQPARTERAACLERLSELAFPCAHVLLADDRLQKCTSGGPLPSTAGMAADALACARAASCLEAPQLTAAYSASSEDRLPAAKLERIWTTLVCAALTESYVG